VHTRLCIYKTYARSRPPVLTPFCHTLERICFSCSNAPFLVSTCEASAPSPSAGSPFNSNNMTVNVSVRHRVLWESEFAAAGRGEIPPVGMCRIGSLSWPVKRLDHSLVECEIPAIPAKVNEEASIVLKQHTILFKKCFVNSSTGFLVEVPCGYVDESEAFLPVCRDRIEDPDIGYSNRSSTSQLCRGCVACSKIVRLDIDLGVSYVGAESCEGRFFTYFFPIIVVQNDTIFPAKLPRDYTPLIINVSIAGSIVLGAFVIYVWAKFKLKQYQNELEDQKVEEMAALLNSPDLDPRIKRILLNAKNRLQNSGNNMIEAWAKWKTDVDEARNTQIFLKVGIVKSQQEYDVLLKKHWQLHDSDKLWTFVWSQLNKGEATWVSTRRIMDILTGFSPYWGDLWACYLEVELEGFRTKLRKVRRLRSYARRGHTVWTKNHDHFESKKRQSWMIFHTFSLDTTRGFSSICRALTKTEAAPTTSIGLGAPLSDSDEELTFVYFGESDSVGIGIANESIPLQIKPHETGRDQKAWYYASGSSQEPYSTVTGEVRIVIKEARDLRSGGRLAIMQPLGLGLGLRPFVQVSTNSLDAKGMPREWKTPTFRGISSSFPKWNEEFRICLRGNEMALRFEVMHDSSPRPVLLGSARVPLNLLMCWRGVCAFFVLGTNRGGQRARG